MANQPQYKIFTTPPGRSMWTKLREPETKWAGGQEDPRKQGGYYEAIIRLTGNESADMRDVITKAYEANLLAAANEYLAEYVEKKPAAKGKFKDPINFMKEKKEGVKINALPFKQLEDDAGELIDMYEFKFKMNARSGSKEDWHDVDPYVVGPDGHQYSEVPHIGHESLLKVKYKLNAYGCTNAWKDKKGNEQSYRAPSIGVSTPFYACQVWDLVVYNRGGGGFEDIEWESNDNAAPAMAGGVPSEFDDSSEDIPF
jgi:hypothetical protein